MFTLLSAILAYQALSYDIVTWDNETFTLTIPGGNESMNLSSRVSPCLGMADWYYNVEDANNRDPEDYGELGLDFDTQAKLNMGEDMVQGVSVELQANQVLGLTFVSHLGHQAAPGMTNLFIVENFAGEMPTSNGYSSLSPTLDECGEADEGAILLTWPQLNITNENSTVSYNVLMTEGNMAPHGLFMTTHCGIEAAKGKFHLHGGPHEHGQHMEEHMEEHMDEHMDDDDHGHRRRQAEEGHHDDAHGEPSVGYYSLWQNYSSETESCITNFNPSTHYHFYVVALVDTDGVVETVLYETVMTTTAPAPENPGSSTSSALSDPFAIASFVAIGFSALVVAGIYSYYTCGESQAAKTGDGLP